ncbi:MAG: 50S ribosomal protein L35 [Rickettsiales bacterium]
MYKLKTKSAIKKRFKITKNGLVVAKHAYKNHFMRHKTTKQSRQLKGTTLILGRQGYNIKKHFAPYGIA